jgi:hypothetical protein
MLYRKIMTKSKAQKALASGPSKIGAKARAAANKLKGEKAPEKTGRHAGSPKQKNEEKLRLTPYGKVSTGKHSKEASGGKHHAPASQSAVKNAYGSIDAPSKGRHSKEAATSASKAKVASIRKDINEKKRLKKLVGR